MFSGCKTNRCSTLLLKSRGLILSSKPNQPGIGHTQSHWNKKLTIITTVVIFSQIFTCVIIVIGIQSCSLKKIASKLWSNYFSMGKHRTWRALSVVCFVRDQRELSMSNSLLCTVFSHHFLGYYGDIQYCFRFFFPNSSFFFAANLAGKLRKRIRRATWRYFGL